MILLALVPTKCRKPTAFNLPTNAPPLTSQPSWDLYPPYSTTMKSFKMDQITVPIAPTTCRMKKIVKIRAKINKINKISPKILKEGQEQTLTRIPPLLGPTAKTLSACTKKNMLQKVYLPVTTLLLVKSSLAKLFSNLSYTTHFKVSGGSQRDSPSLKLKEGTIILLWIWRKISKEPLRVTLDGKE
jgi:hypothetical protein